MSFYFPYMFWAQTESCLSPYSLSLSGMPAPDGSFLDGLGVDLAGPTAGALPELQAKLAELFDVEPERVLVVAGASSGMFLAAARWFRPGTRVAAETPSYEPLRALPLFFGAELRPLQRRLEDDFRVTPEAARSALAGASGAGHLFLTNPHNPSGARMEADEIAALAGEAARAGGVLACCEVYMEFVRPEERVHAFALAPNTITIGSLTKAYGLGALRVGWVILGEGLAHERAALMDRLFLAYVDPPSVALRAARRALDRLPQLLQPLRRVEEESRPLWERWLRETPGVEAHVPPRGLIAFPRIAGVPDTAELVRYLQHEHGVDVVPGEFFGAPGHLRVGCGVPAETLREGLARLTAGLEAWRARR
ncbi:MAG: pyridoxal phosphate-dependent aminotransferase [Planctomycetes bacterium]|nr:pyridoxal phosphate-dependent aminotransferase [Planctomycetota bacterium]